MPEFNHKLAEAAALDLVERLKLEDNDVEFQRILDRDIKGLSVPAQEYTYKALNELGLLRSAKGVPYSARINVSVTDTAKILRKLLKDYFPGFKFTVRSDKYAGGASIHIGYSAQFEESKHRLTTLRDLIGPFGSKSFDGMIDMGYYFTAWLRPTGPASLAYTSGTMQSGGYAEEVNNPNPGGAQLVSFGSNYVFAQRQF